MWSRTLDIKILLKGAIFGGLVFFLWTNISWMAIGWHNAYMSPVPNEEALSQALRTEIPKSGLYFIPWHDMSSDQEDVKRRMETGPFARMMIHPQGKSFDMGLPILLSLLVNCLLSALATYLLLHTKGLSTFQKLGFVKSVGVAGSAWLIFANWNWWGFPTLYLIINLVDIGIAWSLIGLVLAKFVVKD